MRFLELLSPAKNLETGIAAIDAGADAVYIGGPSFGARSSAQNSLEDIHTLCDYAHEFRAKIHVTLNTILTDAELEEARTLAFKLYDAGVDALIIQDTGLLMGKLPPLELHASTQQDNHSPEKVKFLEDAGFTQVVLARELSVKEIQAIHEQTHVSLEAFIHGALCAGMSGRCYLSQALTGRSANRGECAQLCRVKQSLYDESGRCLADGRYLLSLRDLNQSKNLEELIDAGISSFKIEGRLKDQNYVTNVTAWYRELIDNIIAGRKDLMRSSYGKTKTTFTPDPEKSFNRGFTEYNTNEIRQNFANFDAPGYVGKSAGILKKRDGHFLTLSLRKGIVLHNGDSLNYYKHPGELTGFRISSADGNTVEIYQELPPIPMGTEMFRSKDAEFEHLLSDHPATRTLKLSLDYSETETGIIIKATDETGFKAEEKLDLPSPEPSHDLNKLKSNLRNKLGRLGGTPWTLDKIDINLTHSWFVPQSALNNLRRDLLNKLHNAKTAVKPNISHEIPAELMLPEEDRDLGFRANIYNKDAVQFYKTHGSNTEIPAYETDPGTEERPVLVSRHCLAYCFHRCTKQDGIAPGKMFLEIGKHMFRLDFDCRKCLMSVVGPVKTSFTVENKKNIK